MTRRDLDPVALLEDLIRIDSSNPDLVATGGGESAIADFLVDWLATHGFETHRLEETQGRPTVVGLHRGTGGGRSIMLNGHIDTVSLGSYEGNGLVPTIRNGSVYGRGAYDMKSGVAAIMVAAATTASRPHAGDIVVALVADEEYASAGTSEVLRHVVTDTAIVVEPSGLDLMVAHRGFVWAEVTVHGVAAHGSRPDLGVDAIAKAGSFLTAIEDLGHRLASGEQHPLLATGSIHASTITGGTEASTYPDRCVIVVERRTIPGEDVSFVEAELRTILDAIATDDPAFSYDLDIGTHRPPFAAHPESVVAAAVTDSFREVTGSDPVVRGEAFWTDAALLAEAGVDVVLFGVDGGGAHAATEWVTLSSLETLTDTLERTVRVITA